MKIRHRLNQIKNPRDLWLLVRIAALSAILPVLLRGMKLPRLLKMLASRNTTTVVDTAQIDKTVRFTSFVLSRRRLGNKSWCLKRSLLLYHFLGQAGLPVEINFGIQKTNDSLEGHAWLTRGGEVYLDSEERTSDYEVIYSSVGTK